MKILIIDNGTSFLSKLKNLLKNNDLTIIPFNKISVRDANNFDFIILSGGHKYSVLNHKKNYHNELEIIRKSNKPMLGICLGFELIAFDFGCKLKRLRVKEKGIVQIELTKDKIIKNLKSIKVYESHRWVIKEVSKYLLPLGVSVDGIEIIKHKSKPIYGFQFHPEIVRNGLDSKVLFSNLLSIITK